MKVSRPIINVGFWSVMIFCLLAIAWPNLIDPYCIKPLQRYDQRSREAIMVLYAQELQAALQDGQQKLSSQYPRIAASLNQYVRSKRPYGFTTPYNPQDGPVEIIDVDDNNQPLQRGIERLCNKIGYYYNGGQYRLCVWRKDNTLLKVFSGKCGAA